MSFFDRRTDTEKELEAYRKSHPTNERQSPFDRYNNTESTQNNTQSDYYYYNSENYNNTVGNINNTANNTDNNINTTNTYTNVKSSKKHTAANIVIAILVVLLIGSVAGIFILASMGHIGLTFVMFGQVFFLFGIIGCISNLKSNKKSLTTALTILIFSVVGLFIMVSGFLNEFSYSQITEYLSHLLRGKLVSIFICSIFIIIGAAVCIYVNIKRSKSKNRCNVPVIAEIFDVKTIISGDEGPISYNYVPVYRYYYKGREYIKASNVYTSKRIVIGAQTEIFIKPNDANDIYEPQRMPISSIIIGVVFVIMGIFAIVSILSGG